MRSLGSRHMRWSCSSGPFPPHHIACLFGCLNSKDWGSLARPALVHPGAPALRSQPALSFACWGMNILSCCVSAAAQTRSVRYCRAGKREGMGLLGLSAALGDVLCWSVPGLRSINTAALWLPAEVDQLKKYFWRHKRTNWHILCLCQVDNKEILILQRLFF